MLLERNPNARLQVVLGERNYNELQVDNSSLTGESEPQARSPEFTHEVDLPIYSTFNCLGLCRIGTKILRLGFLI